MNAFVVYDAYRKQHAAEFRTLLKRVAKEALAVTENIPEEILLEIFKKDKERRYINFDDLKKHIDDVIYLSYGPDIYMEKYYYNEGPAKEMDSFMEEYYPGISCCRSYRFDLYKREFEFTFSFIIEFEDEDFEKGSSGIYMLKNYKKHMERSISLFNDDISELLKKEFTKESWDELNFYGKDDIVTSYYDSGWAYVRFSIDDLLS